MLREFTLQPNEDKRIQVEGQFLVITQATGAVELTIGGTTPITVDEKDRIHLRGDSPNDRAIRIKNVSGAVNTIELHTSDLLVDKRTGVNVTNSLSIAEDQIIGIDPNANIVQALIQNAVRIDPNGNTITIAPGQSIGIDPLNNTVSAEIQNPVTVESITNTVNTALTTPVDIAPNQTIGISPQQNTVALAPDQTIGIRGQVELQRRRKRVLPIDAIELRPNPGGTASNAIPANSAREKLIITARNNTNDVWIGGALGQVGVGLPLANGERVEMEVTDYMTVVCDSDADVYAVEINPLGVI